MANSANFATLPTTDKGKQKLVQLQQEKERTNERYMFCMSQDRLANEQAKRQRSTQEQLLKNASARRVNQNQASQSETSSDVIGAKSNNNNVNAQVSTNATPDRMDETSETTRPEERREHSSKTIIYACKWYFNKDWKIVNTVLNTVATPIDYRNENITQIFTPKVDEKILESLSYSVTTKNIVKLAAIELFQAESNTHDSLNIWEFFQQPAFIPAISSLESAT